MPKSTDRNGSRKAKERSETTAAVKLREVKQREEQATIDPPTPKGKGGAKGNAAEAQMPKPTGRETVAERQRRRVRLRLSCERLSSAKSEPP